MSTRGMAVLGLEQRLRVVEVGVGVVALADPLDGEPEDLGGEAFALGHAHSRGVKHRNGYTRRHVLRTAIVTGAASGIGRAIAAAPRRRRLRRPRGRPQARRDGPGVPYAADLTTREGNRGAVEAALERFGRLDAIVPNAGFQHVSPVAEFPEDRWDGLIALLLTSPFLLARYALGAPGARAATGASSRSPRCTASSPRPTRPATCRRSTA